jgi:hypothetical protein
MFVVNHAGQTIACMDFRLLDQHPDICNVLLRRSESDKGLMSQVMRLLCSFIATGQLDARHRRASVAIESGARVASEEHVL